MLKILNTAKQYIDALAIFAIFLSSFTFYLAAIDGDFVFDDLALVSSDQFYHQSSTATIADCFRRTWWRKEFSQGLYRPLTIATYLLNSRLSGLNPRAFRLTNIILHSLLCSVLYLLFLRLCGDRKISFLSAIFFAVHPIHAEAVIPASGRADLLASLFLLFGFLFHSAKNLNVAIRFLLVFLCATSAALSKEFGVILLPLCFISDLIFDCEFRKNVFRFSNRLFISYCASFFSVIVYFLMRIFLVGYPFPQFSTAHFWSDNHLGLLSFWERLPTALWLQAYAIWKFFYPVHLSHDYSYAQIVPINPFFS